MLYYPMSNGRSIDEILRLVKAMQTSDAYKVATPENWQPGEQVIVPPPGSVDEANARVAGGEYDCVEWYFCKTNARVAGGGYDCVDWYFCKKSL